LSSRRASRRRRRPCWPGGAEVELGEERPGRRRVMEGCPYGPRGSMHEDPALNGPFRLWGSAP
jgi:hypothetical protein